MIEVRIEFKNVKCERIAKHLAKIKVSEYKVWEYNNVVYSSIRLSSMSNLKGLIKKLKQNHLEFHISRICSSSLWEKLRACLG
jgi:hypothetical protein